MRFARDVPLMYWLMQRFLWAVLKLLTRFEMTGQEHVPLTGPLIVAPNHLHSFDIPVIGYAIPRQVVVFAADKWRGKPGGWVMERITRVIYVARGEADRDALSQALAVLKDGGAMAVAPEGTRSRTGQLQPGKHGASYLASRSGATIVPVAVWGHEKAFANWRRLRRPAIHVRIGTPIRLPPGAEHARTAELHAYTDDLMLALAALLPPEYRGVYADRITGAAARR